MVPIITKNLHDEILDLFPKGLSGETVDIKGVAERISELKRCPSSLALPTTWNSGLTSLSAMVTNLNAGLGPSEKDIRQFDSFRTQVVKRCEFWCTHQITSKHEGVSKHGESRDLFGKKALEYIYDDMMEIYGKQGIMETEHLKIFRKFGWLLSQEQRVITDKWIKVSVAQKPLLIGLQAVTDAVGVLSVPAGSGGGASSSSASASKCLQISKDTPASRVFPHSTPKRDTADIDSRQKAETNSMMIIFGSKAIIK